MKKLIWILIITSVAIVLSGCSQTIVKYQCADGSFVDSANSCSLASCKTNCPQLDCASCLIRAETQVETMPEKISNVSSISNTNHVVDEKTDSQNTQIPVFRWSYNDLDGPILSTSFGLKKGQDPFVFRAFIVSEDGKNYGYEADQSIILIRSGSGGELSSFSEGGGFVEFSANIYPFIAKGWSDRIVTIYLVEDAPNLYLNCNQSLATFEKDVRPKSYIVEKRKVPKIDDDWLVDYDYIDACSLFKNCSQYLNSLAPDIKAFQSKQTERYNRITCRKQ